MPHHECRRRVLRQYSIFNMPEIVAWCTARCTTDTLCLCLPTPWKRLRLIVDGCSVHIGGNIVELVPSVEAVAVHARDVKTHPAARALWSPAPPPGPLIGLRLSSTSEWLLRCETDSERASWLRALMDGIDLSHGPLSPYGEWSFGAELGKGTFGVCRAVEHRRTRERAVCKLVSRSFIDAHAPAKEALAREIDVMRKLNPLAGLAGGGLAVLRLLSSCEYGDLTFLFVSPECRGDLLQLLQQAMSAR